ncbi:MAG TPA: sigma-54 dependent transcriptional regulator [Thermoanaerobaculia bacterium]|nr:sigma-54 dependent transcriptional regulator [Thermoanaerobaculia bacterium]
MFPEQGETWRDAETRTGSDWQETTCSLVPGLTILAHSEVRRIGERAALLDLASGREEPISRLEPSFGAPGEPWRRPLADPHLSRRPLWLLPEGGGSVRLACRSSSIFVIAQGEPVRGERLFTDREIERGVVLLLGNRVTLLLHRFRPVSEPSLPRYGFVGESEPILEIRRQIRQVADLEVPVLLLGETGTGKELLAQAIHQASARRAHPYLAVNMGAIPPSLAAAELFGAAKGAYTGADQKRRGFFSRADGGTLFLDEIGEVPPEVQPLLLRALENGEIQPVGTEQIQRVDVRTIAATDSDLEAAIASGRFRAPLLHRLSGYEIRIPPLRQRRDDIGRLLLHFLRQELEAVGEAHRLEPAPADRPWLHASLVARLALYDWPGNVRQLRNVARTIAVESRGSAEVRIGAQIERLLVPFSGETRAEMETVAAPALETVPSPSRAPARPSQRRRSPQEVSDEELVAALRANRWEPGATAEQIGISRAAVYLLIDACPLTRKASDLERSEIEQALLQSGGRLAEAAEQLEVSEEGLKRQTKKLGLRPSSPQILR